ncbi:hypothetical protein QBB33_01935 [Streptomyces scabiei]|uniref:hypothetical protein n=1 Tax=Streptomyces scabiei TaxID=1930 RepID=UPI001F360A16|nr:MULTISPECIES: hypothetical protein [unclassified Streptomyces]
MTVADSIGQSIEVVAGGGYLAELPQAGASNEEHIVQLRLEESGLSTTLEHVSIGPQGLREGRVAFVVRPGCEQGGGGDAGGLVALVRGEGVAGGALDELVDADGLMWVVGGVVDEAEPVQGAQGTHPVPRGDRVRFLGEAVAGTGAVLGEVGKGRLAG